MGEAKQKRNRRHVCCYRTLPGAACGGGTAARLLLCSPLWVMAQRHTMMILLLLLFPSPLIRHWGQEWQRDDLSSRDTIQEFRSSVPSATKGSCGLAPLTWPPPDLTFPQCLKGDKGPSNEVVESRIYKSMYDKVDLPSTAPNLLARSTPASPCGLSHKLEMLQLPD